MSAMIKATEAVVRINGRNILDRVSLTVEPGEIVTLVGPNGAGKSTLLRLLSGELRPFGGRMTLKGRPIESFSAHALSQHRAVLSQHTNVVFPFTVAEIVRMGANPAKSSRTVDAAVAETMAECDVTHLAEQSVTRLSGGEQQRVHLARTLLQIKTADDPSEPKLLLLDEPTASLDLGHQLRVLELVKRLAASGSGIVVVIHDLNLAAMLATRVAMMKRGFVVATGSPGDVIASDIIETVFGVTNSVGILPAGEVPFVLPQSMRICE
jgi:iron complex transport system ATP-binding protein